MNVGDYVRFKTLSKEIKIGKVINIIVPDNDNPLEMHNYNVYDLDNNEVTVEDYVIKSSSDLFEILEIGDYVNGKKIVDKWEEPNWYGYFIKLEGEQTIPTMRKIESIVTKEQFESMQYRIGE